LAWESERNSAVFSLVNAVLLRPLPYPEPDQLVGLGQWRNQAGEGYVQTGVSAPNIENIAQSGVFQYVGYYRFSRFNITEEGRPESVRAISASDGVLPLFGLQPMLGRFLTREEMEPGHDGVAVIGNHLWTTRYNADPSVLNRTIELNQKRYTIVGVMPSSFRFTWDQEIDVFVPLVLTPEERSEKGRGTSRDLQTQARVRSGLTVAQAQAAMDTLAENLARQYPDANKGWGIKVEPLHAAYHRRMQTPLLIMLGAVMFVLLIACANVANLLLARATGRRREVAIRIAIGATRGQLLAQLLTESMLLAIGGGVLGLVLGFFGDRLLTFALAHSQFFLPNAKIIDIDWRVLLFSVAATVVTGVIFGLAPGWATVKSELADSLKETGLNITTAVGGRRLRNALVVGEMALSLILLTGAGLLVRTFFGLMNVDLGIRPQNVSVTYVSLPSYKYASAQQKTVFFDQLVERLQATPGIEAAGTLSGGANVFFQPEGTQPAAPGQEPTASFKTISPGYLKTMGIRIIAGREFTAHDDKAAPPVAIISEKVASRYWPHANPIGAHVTTLARVYSGQSSGSTQPLEIVGVVKDIRNDDVWRPEAAIYIPFDQSPSAGAQIAVRTAGAVSVTSVLREIVQSLDKEQPVNEVRAMNDIVAETYGAIRFPMTLLWIFSALALVLSAIGIFGVMSYMVGRRSHEIAIRLALGAGRGTVLQLVMGEAFGITGGGIVLGLIGSAALSRIMSGYVYGISTTDPLTFAAAAALLAAVSLLASYLPAQRATRVDPMIALRYE
jgi:putative ABC transport system permease protein